MFAVVISQLRYHAQVGEKADSEKSGRTLNRVVEWGREGITIEADQRHVREICKDLELERANHSATAVERDNEGNARARARTNVNRDSAKPNTIGMMRVTVTTRAECR